MSPEEFGQILRLGHETRGVEFKGPCSRTDKSAFAKVVKAVLAMSNRRDGGKVVIGVDERDDGSNTTLAPTGLTPEQLSSWKHDDVVESLAKYADPYVTLATQHVAHSGQMFVVLEVAEFDESPVLCAHPFNEVLRTGGCYMRRRDRIESSEIASHVEMRELLDLATEKGIRRFLQQANRAGLQVADRVLPNDPALFAKQRECMQSDLITEIRRGSFWEVVIRPATFLERRVEKLTDLEKHVFASQVRIRGWLFPSDARHGLTLRDDHVASEVDWENHRESWRLYQSGMFVWTKANRADLVPVATAGSSVQQGQRCLWVGDALFLLSEVFEFASRLALLPTGDQRMRVEVSLHGLLGRRLELGEWRDNPGRRSESASWTFPREYSSQQLASEARELALAASADLFQRFGWDASTRVLGSILDQYRR